MMVVMIGIVWFSHVATTFDVSIESLTPRIGQTMGVQVEAPIEGFIFSRFFKIGFLDAVRIILVFHGADLLLLLLTLIGIAITYRFRTLRKPEFVLFSLYTVSLALLFTFGYVLNIGLNWYDRTIRLAAVFTPIFASMSLYYIEAKMHRKIVPFLIIVLLLALSTVQLYRCEPLIPAASSFSKNLPDDEPLVYVNNVNTVYQRSMIAHAERSFPTGTKITSDEATQKQLLGLTSVNFSRAHMGYYPLSGGESREFDYFLIHIPGKSGKFHENAETRTTSLIVSAIYNSSYNILYTNSESYILCPRAP